GVVKDAPNHLHPHDLGGSRPWLGLGLRLLGRLPLFRSTFLILILVYDLLSVVIGFALVIVLFGLFFLFHFLFLAFAALRGLVVGTQVLAIQNASGHEKPPVS